MASGVVALAAEWHHGNSSNGPRIDNRAMRLGGRHKRDTDGRLRSRSRLFHVRG